MKTSASALLPAIIVTLGALGGCEWIAGIENTTIGLDAMRPADAALPADGSTMTSPDGGGGEPDGGGDRPDAAVDCPEPCVVDDDAFADFDGNQTGANGRWLYAELQPETNSYVPMAPVSVNGVPGFQGTGTPRPSLTYCATTDTPPCFELPGLLALATTAPDAHHPALRWIAPELGLYSVSAFYKVSSVAPMVETTVMLTLNDQSTVLDSRTEVLTIGGNQLYAEPELAVGDAIVLSAIATTDTSVSVGVNVTITGPY
jgi:hypothetical protein